MALSENRIVYGIHSIVPYSRTDGMPYGIFKVLAGGTISLAAEYEDLYGGSQKYPWASELKTISAEFTASVKSMPDFLFELFLGASISTTVASATGTCSTLTNIKGTSCKSATIGVASATLKSASDADLKAGKYIVKVVSATTVDVYCLTDVEFGRGTDLTFQNDDLKITASALTIATATEVTIPSTGIELTGGSGTIGMTIGDTAEFYVAAPHGGISEITVGQDTAEFPEHGQLCVAAKRSNGDIFEVELYKVVAAGFPIGFEETTFSIPELTAKVLYDSVKNKVYNVRAISHA